MSSIPGRRPQQRLQVAQGRAPGSRRPVEFLIEPLAEPGRAVLEVEFPEAVAAGLEGAQIRV